MNNIPPPLRRTRDEEGEPEQRREPTMQYELTRQARDGLDNGLDRTQALHRTDHTSESTDSSLSLTLWRNHSDDMFRQAHESVIMRSDILSPLSNHRHDTTSVRERRSNNFSLLELIDEALAILDDDSDDHHDSNCALGSQYRKQ
jgi:hypothetical protein